MISALGFTFVVLPCIAAVVVGALVRDWRLAAATLCGGLALIFIAPVLPSAFALLGLPVFAGVVLGGVAMTIGLYRSPDMDLWARMITTLVVAFAATYLNLLLNTNGA